MWAPDNVLLVLKKPHDLVFWTGGDEEVGIWREGRNAIAKDGHEIRVITFVQSVNDYREGLVSREYPESGKEDSSELHGRGSRCQ